MISMMDIVNSFSPFIPTDDATLGDGQSRHDGDTGGIVRAAGTVADFQACSLDLQATDVAKGVHSGDLLTGHQSATPHQSRMKAPSAFAVGAIEVMSSHSSAACAFAPHAPKVTAGTPLI